MLGSSAEVRVRKGRPSDATRLAEVFRDCWRHTYAGIIPHLHLESLIGRRGRDWWRHAMRTSDGLLVLEVGGRITGYATLGPSRTKGEQQGEIYELYVEPTYQGLGFGELLFEACRHRLDQRRLKGLIVWALIENTGATSFYWRRGGRPATSTFDRIGRKKLEKVAFVWN